MGQKTRYGYKLDQTGQQTQDLLDDINNKVDKVDGKGLSANDFTDTDKDKLDGIEAGAEANVQADWSQNDPSADDYVRNRTHYEETSAIKIDNALLAWSGSTSQNLDFWFHGTNVHIPRTSTGWGLTWQGGKLFIDDNGFGYELGVYNGEEWSINPFDPSYDQQPYPLNVDVVITSGTTVHKLPNKFLDMDSEPTTGSDKPVTSGGVKAAISNFITRSVNDLANYYLKSETYTKAEVESLIGAIQHFHYEIYPNLESVTHLASNILYLIGPTGSGTDRYEEYVYDSTKTNPWVKIGDTSIDLSGYVTTEALNTALANYVTSAALATALSTKQNTLVSGENIKTVNGQSILGSGNIPIEGASDAVKYTSQSLTDAQKEQARTNIGAADVAEVSQLRSEVDGVELLDFNTGALKAKYVDNSYVNKTNGAFAPYNGWSRTDYINVSLFSSVKISTTTAMTYNAFYDKDKAFIKAFSLTSGDNILSIPDNAWYIVISSTTSTTKAATFAIGEYRFTVLRDIGDRLIKLKFMASSGSLDTGEYGYRTDTKKIRYNNGTSVVDIPFYPGAVYNYENKLYIYNGDTIVPATNTKYSDSPIFESAVQELLISGYDAAWVNSITAFRFTAVAEGNIEYITLFAGSTSYSFRRVNDGISGVLFFRRDSSDTAEQGKGIYVLMNRAKFSTISTNTSITLDSGMVLNLGTMPIIREYLSGLTDGDVSFITPTFVANQKAIGQRGWIVDIANDSYYYTAPIQVKRGDIIFLTVTCSSSLVAIAKTDAYGSFYIPVAIGKGGSGTDYQYVAENDGYLAFTINTDNRYSIRKVSSPVYDAVKKATADAIFRDCAELYLAGDLSKAPTYADLMARYDALITAYPDMMTKTKIGESVNGQDIFEIKITKGAYNNAGRRGGTNRDAEIAKPKFMIASGTHGYEPGSPNALCLFVSELVKGHPALSAIRNNVELRIIPCVNPDGYDANTRTNANGVDINRNYNYNWTLHDEGEQNYSGPSAASEPETQAVQSWIDANTDAVFCLDWHQSSFNEEISCLGGTTLVEATGQAAFKRMYLVAINGIAGMLISRRGVADSSIFAYAYNENGSVHGIFNGYLANKGVPGGCLEVPASVADSGDDSPLTISVAADVIGNLCKKAEEKYHI